MLNSFVALAGLAGASVTDLRERIVPDWLSYSMVGLGFVYHAALSVVEWSPGPLLLCAGSAVLAFAFAYLLWRIGAWAGGDVKLFTGMGALVPWMFPFVSFLNSVLLSFPFILLFVLFRTATVKRLRPVFKKMVFRGVRNGAALGVLGVAIAFASNPLLDAAGAGMVVGYAVFMALFWEVLSYGRREALRSRVKARDLCEGMISAETIVLVKGKAKRFSPSLLQRLCLSEPENAIASMYCAAGLEKKDIRALKRHGVKHLWVRESMPMVPVLFFGALAAVLYGNLAVLLLELL